MKAEVIQQRSLLELAELDAELSRIEHRVQPSGRTAALRAGPGRPPRGQRQARVAAARARRPGRADRASSSPRSKRCASARTGTARCSTAGAINAKQLAELQHELETLERRQASLEDSLLEVMERREELQTQQADELATIDATGERTVRRAAGARRRAGGDRAGPTPTCLAARRIDRRTRRRSGGAVRAAARPRRRGRRRLQGRRCGACRIEIDRGELARIAAAADDEVLRCPECGAILLRVKDGD